MERPNGIGTKGACSALELKFWMLVCTVLNETIITILTMNRNSLPEEAAPLQKVPYCSRAAQYCYKNDRSVHWNITYGHVFNFVHGLSDTEL